MVICASAPDVSNFLRDLSRMLNFLSVNSANKIFQRERGDSTHYPPLERVSLRHKEWLIGPINLDFTHVVLEKNDQFYLFSRFHRPHFFIRGIIRHKSNHDRYARFTRM